MILITGCAGFVGFHLSKKMLANNYDVLGIDNLNNYYDVNLKNTRLGILTDYKNFEFIKADISNNSIFDKIDLESIDFIVHLAAQAGVRYSIERPDAYFESNIKGFFNIIEATRNTKNKKLIYASSSSVYGNNNKVPFEEADAVDTPMSFYAATKKSNEIMAESYANIYNLNVTGLRFFTVYGPNGRPDMAYYKFIDKIYNNKPIQIYNNGNLERDFTYIDDIVESIYKLFLKKEKESAYSHQIFNIGNGNPVNLMQFIQIIEIETGKNAIKEFLPMQPGDVYKTWANTEKLQKEIDYIPNIGIDEGIKRFVQWYKEYYKK